MISEILKKQCWILGIWAVFLNSCSGRKADLIVMTYQVESADSTSIVWPSLKSNIVNSINQYTPDVFGLQDISKGECYALAIDLSAYQCITSDDNYNITKLNPLFFKSNRYELIAKARYSIASSVDADIVSGSVGYVTWVKLKELKSGYIFFVFNTNFIEGYSLNNNDLVDFANRISNIAGHAPAVIIGDFGNLNDQKVILQQFNKQLKDSALMVESAKTKASSVVSNSYFETQRNVIVTNNGLGPTIAFFDFSFETFGK